MANQKDSALRIDTMRSQLGRARGLGSAKSGSHTWWMERLTSVALVPLTIWFIVSVLALLGAEQQDVAEWAARPVNAVLLLCLVVITFRHLQLGLTAVIEDYVRAEPAKMIRLLLMKAITTLAGLAGVIAVLKLAL